MPSFGDLFGSGGAAEQFLIWGVLQQLLQPLMSPLVAEIGKLVNSAAPDQPVDLSVAVQAVARKFLDEGSGYDKANDLGIGRADFDLMVEMAQNAPDISTVFEAFRRNLIDVGDTDPEQVSVRGALIDKGIRPEWLPIMQKLAVQIPTVAEIMNAWLQGQITEDEARRRYTEAGGDPSWFQTSYNANGTAPTPMQALEMLNRGIIPSEGQGPESISYHQAFLEGPWRNKWEAPFRGLADYLPPPRTVTAMFHEGTLSHAQAADLLAKQGLQPDLIAAYLAASTTTTTSQAKHLTQTSILALYADKLISNADAKQMLVGLKYSAHDADLLLELQDARAKASQVTSAVSRIKAEYLAGQLTDSSARAALSKLGVPSGQVADVITVWRLEIARQSRTLSESQVAAAYYYQFIAGPEAMHRLESMGYSTRDAWLLIATRLKAYPQDIPVPPNVPPPPKKGH